MADQFIDKWYFDNTSKMSPYEGLISGPVNLTAQVNADGLDSACPNGITIDAGHSAIGIDVKLLELKR